MARRKARAIPRRGRPTGPRGPQSKPAPRGRGRPSPRGPQPLRDLRPGGSSRSAPRGRGRPSPRGRAGFQKNRATRPTLSVADLRRKAGTLPRPRAGGSAGGLVGAGVGAIGNLGAIGALRGAPGSNPRAGKGRPIQTPRPAPAAGKGRAIQRPIPNRDGRMAQFQADIARANRANIAASRQPDIAIPPMAPRPMPTSDYMRQQMPPQQIQRGMGRGPMPRANIGQIQAPRPTFGQQMRSPLPRRRR